MSRGKRPGFGQGGFSPLHGEDEGKQPAVNAVIFDFDGTLAALNIDFVPIKEEILNLIEDYGVPRESLREKYLLEIIDEAHSLVVQRERRSAAQFRERAHTIVVERELEAASRGRLLPGVEAMLRGLKVAGLKVGIVTRNCDRAVRRVFPHIESLCDVFLSRDSVKKVKPDPQHLATLLDRLGVSERHALMVGDHPMDILAGKRVGMRTAGVLTGRTTREELEKAGADYILESASQLATLMGRLSR